MPNTFNFAAAMKKMKNLFTNSHVAVDLWYNVFNSAGRDM